MKILKKHSYYFIFIVIYSAVSVKAANLMIAVPYSTSLDQQLFKTTRESSKAHEDNVAAESLLRQLFGPSTTTTPKPTDKPQEIQTELLNSLFQSASAPTPVNRHLNSLFQSASAPTPVNRHLNSLFQSASAPTPATYPVNRDLNSLFQSASAPTPVNRHLNSLFQSASAPTLATYPRNRHLNNLVQSASAPSPSTYPVTRGHYGYEYDHRNIKHEPTSKATFLDNDPSKGVTITIKFNQPPIGQEQVIPESVNENEYYNAPRRPSNFLEQEDYRTINNYNDYAEIATHSDPITSNFYLPEATPSTLRGTVEPAIGQPPIGLSPYLQPTSFPSTTSTTSQTPTLLIAGLNSHNTNTRPALGYHQAQHSQQMENVIYDFDDTIFNNGFLKGIRDVISNGIKIIRDKPIIPNLSNKPKTNPIVVGKEIFSIAPLHPEKVPTKPVQQISLTNDMGGNGYGITTEGGEEVDKGLGFLSFSKAASSVLDTVTNIPSNIDLMFNDLGRTYRQQLFNLKDKVTQIKNSRSKSKSTGSQWLDDFGAK